MSNVKVYEIELNNKLNNELFEQSNEKITHIFELKNGETYFKTTWDNEKVFRYLDIKKYKVDFVLFIRKMIEDEKYLERKGLSNEKKQNKII